MLDIAGCIVTIDAIGCQKEIVNLISQKGGDYIIALKKNQKSLYENAELLFKEAISKRLSGFSASHHSTKDSGHGREEIRNYLMFSNISNQINSENKWENLKSIGMVESVRTENGHEFRLEKMGQASNNTNSFELPTNQSIKPATGSLQSFFFKKTYRAPMKIF